MKNRLTGFLTVAFIFAMTSLFGQSESSDFFRSVGKIYVVVAVLVSILVGLLIFLVYMERRIAKLEQQLKEES
ncbi:MAG: CcmD family protein [Bacteroidota bacterium]